MNHRPLWPHRPLRAPLSYHRETALQGWLVLDETGRLLELRDNILRNYTSIFNHCDIIGQQSYRIR